MLASLCLTFSLATIALEIATEVTSVWMRNKELIPMQNRTQNLPLELIMFTMHLL